MTNQNYLLGSIIASLEFKISVERGFQHIKVSSAPHLEPRFRFRFKRPISVLKYQWEHKDMNFPIQIHSFILKTRNKQLPLTCNVVFSDRSKTTKEKGNKTQKFHTILYNLDYSYKL